MGCFFCSILKLFCKDFNSLVDRVIFGGSWDIWKLVGFTFDRLGIRFLEVVVVYFGLFSSFFFEEGISCVRIKRESRFGFVV